ncbi:unnamed protein product [Paramecium sonneborni]|uniref:Uncharacterized protein n=1 Tax=Paramecium sonneborni TaxID=65129 RepID=A0A8S1PEK3_9CILI|nr:unnamed protein product [Paramecium sonneborni]
MQNNRGIMKSIQLKERKLILFFNIQSNHLREVFDKSKMNSQLTCLYCFIFFNKITFFMQDRIIQHAFLKEVTPIKICPKTYLNNRK